MKPVVNPKELSAGAIYFALGGIALWLNRPNPVGTAEEMGPGYFPLALGIVLIIIGAISMIRSLSTRSEPIGVIAWKALLLVPLSVCLFAWTLPRLGAPVALLLLLVAGATSSRHFRPDIKTVAILCLMVAGAVLVFVRFLGVPMPLVGTIFGG